jgi:MOSC domain-containing protein YiiM
VACARRCRARAGVCRLKGRKSPGPQIIASNPDFLINCGVDIATVASVQAGRIAPLGPQRIPSAFVKHNVAGPVHVGLVGLDMDEQADLRVHGGPEKAVYAYASAHYPAWASEIPALASRFIAGSFGENLTITGLTEQDLCVGDIHGIGSVRLQVCQPRQPCAKLALNFEYPRLPKAMVRSGRSGWYYRVLESGTLHAGDRVELLERPLPDFPFNDLLRFLYAPELEVDGVRRIATTPEVADTLRAAAKHMLESRP